jgi:hypothetical protein
MPGRAARRYCRYAPARSRTGGKGRPADKARIPHRASPPPCAGRQRGRDMEDPSPISGAIETVAKRLVKPIPIASAIETLADRLGATNEQAWADIKSKAAYGRLSLAGVDDKGRLCDLEPHWISYIVPWVTEDPSPACASAPIGAPTPSVRQHPATSDMPRDQQWEHHCVRPVACDLGLAGRQERRASAALHTAVADTRRCGGWRTTR